MHAVKEYIEQAGGVVNLKLQSTNSLSAHGFHAFALEIELGGEFFLLMPQAA